ncbi:hypothetical protein FHS95_002669 [Sphingomonas naasensis]|uniref:Class I SAM-dependent methyltransferase n=1 Tax=Sphingomonas naasensis TaxID=1344951 RepID=A0A4S1WJI9_9SPHN|nr:class I SAM-dependent methyltransferase [Sphingomonas naasensis]NIJ20977.1 hypothetical protein [Sphingomonas naasensis]TGX43361.1 hypothetical protein E5A74_09370 [Sphingomonas naasensis]
MSFGTFIAPYETAQDIAALEARLQGHIGCGYRAVWGSRAFLGQNRIYDRIVAKIESLDLAYEDQCSTEYYFDLVRTLRDFNGQFDRVVEVGVFMGGSTAYLAGCAEPFDFDIDLVDVSASYLRFAYERARRMYPEAAKRIRLFHGDLPTYVREVMLAETDRRSIVHHDGCHEFNQVVKDMGALSYVQQSLLAVIAQDTHLRGSAKYLNFVDLALYAVFGTDLKFAPIGKVLGEHDPLTRPDQYHGNFFMAGAPEGLVLPMAANRFVYPHPAHKLEDLLPSEAEIAKVLAFYGDDNAEHWTAADAA